MIHIIIITFNRSKSLLKTLKEIENSTLNQFKLTILDNASTDDTKLISENYCRRNNNARYVKNKVNIGACANTMRAYELADDEYTWLICDDDNYNFSQAERIIDVISEKKPDVMIVGTPVQINSVKYLECSENKDSAQNFNIGKAVFAMSFLPAAIIKSSKLRSCDYRIGYDLSHTLFPQFFWISKSITENWKIEISEAYLISRPNSDTGMRNEFEHINGYLKCLKLFSEKSLVKKVYDVYFESAILHIRILFSAVMRCKSKELDTMAPLIEHFINNPFSIGKIASLCLMPITFIPKTMAQKYVHWRARQK